MKKLYIDGSNLIHRSHWVSKNSPVSSAYIFLTSIRKYVNAFETSDIYITWDLRQDPDAVNHRLEILGEQYKGNRDKEKSAEAFKNVEHVDKLTTSLGIKNLYPKALEADDIIAWLCLKKYQTDPAIVISTDKDLLQLVSEYVHVYNPIKDQLITTSNFKDIVGVDQDIYLSYKAVMGDKSDNISGIPKVGPKRAADIAKDIENRLKKEHIDIYDRNKKLMCLSYSLDVNLDEVEYLDNHLNNVLKTTSVDMQCFERVCKYYNMVNVINNIQDWRTLFAKESQTQSIREAVNAIDFSRYFE